jgi:hypothetical protein
MDAHNIDRNYFIKFNRHRLICQQPKKHQSIKEFKSAQKTADYCPKTEPQSGGLAKAFKFGYLERA